MVYVCPFCGELMPSGYEPEQWACCGEVGHAITEDEFDALWAQNTLPQHTEEA